LFLSLGSFGAVAMGGIVYVDADAPGANNGSSWTDAYRSLVDALAAATDGDEVRVAQGRYTPAAKTGEPLDRDVSFVLVDGVALEGGYAGYGQADPNARDAAEYETILSGDSAGDDQPVDDPCELMRSPWRSDNCYHVVNASTCDERTLIEGFTISGGQADGEGESARYGAGLLRGKPTVRQCRFICNAATYWGSAVYFDEQPYYSYEGGKLAQCVISRNFTGGGSAVEGCGQATECIFENNVVDNGSGAAMYFGNGQTGVLTDCTFSNNRVYYHGGVIRTQNGSPRFIRCTFVENRAGVRGGAVYLDGCGTCQESYPEFDRCKFVGNKAPDDGGAIYVGGNTHAKFVNCLIVGNESHSSGGGLCDAAYFGCVVENCTIADNKAVNCGAGIRIYRPYYTWYPQQGLLLVNSILWGNFMGTSRTFDSQLCLGEDGSRATVSFNCIESLSTGCCNTGNINLDPLFARPGYWDPRDYNDPDDDSYVDGDYHLKSRAGRWDPNSAQWVQDMVTSPCVDAGDPSTAAGPEPGPNGCRRNMGAYGGTTEASKSPAAVPPCACGPSITGDINGDCRVDWLDFRLMAANWMQTVDAGQEPPGDDE